MPAEIDVRAVTRPFPEIPKNPPEFFVNVKLHGMTLPEASYPVKTPITVPIDSLLLIVELLILMVI